MSKKDEHKVVRIRKCFVITPTLRNLSKFLHQSIVREKVDYRCLNFRAIHALDREKWISHRKMEKRKIGGRNLGGEKLWPVFVQTSLQNINPQLVISPCKKSRLDRAPGRDW